MAASALPPEEMWPYIPAALPPPGVESNPVNPEDRGYVGIAVGSVLTALMTTFFLARVYTKSVVVKKFTWDDLTCSIAFFGALVYFGIIIWGAVRGPIGKHQWDVSLAEIASNDFIITSAYLDGVLPAQIFGVLKLTFFILYLQLFHPMRWLRVCIYVGAAIEVIAYGAFTITMFVLMTPTSTEDWVTHLYSQNEHNAQYKVSIPVSCFGLVVDLYLLVLPLIAISRLQMPTQRKIGVAFIFMSGILACIASLLSIYYRVLDNQSNDTTWLTENIVILALTEMNVGVMVACMPAFSRMAQHHMTFYQSLKTTIYERFSILRTSRGSTGSKNKDRYPKSATKFPAAETDSGTPVPGRSYVMLRDLKSPEVDSKPGGTEGLQYELGQLQSTRTVIGAGRQQDRVPVEDDRIHLRQEIWQEH